MFLRAADAKQIHGMKQIGVNFIIFAVGFDYKGLIAVFGRVKFRTKVVFVNRFATLSETCAFFVAHGRQGIFRRRVLIFRRV